VMAARGAPTSQRLVAALSYSATKLLGTRQWVRVAPSWQGVATSRRGRARWRAPPDGGVAAAPTTRSILKLDEQLAGNLDRKVLRHVEERCNCLGAPIIGPLLVEQLEDTRNCAAHPLPLPPQLLPQLLELLAVAQELGEVGKRGDFGGEFGDGTLTFLFCLL